MARVNFRETIALPNGPGGSLLPISGIAFIPFVVNPDGSEGAQSPAYVDRTSATVVNSFTTDATGSVSYWLNAGDYNIHVSDQQTPARITAYIMGFLVPLITPNPTYITTIGDGVNSSFTITHNLTTQDILVSVYSNSSPFEEVDVEVQHLDVNNVKLLFSFVPTANQFKVNIAAMSVL